MISSTREVAPRSVLSRRFNYYRRIFAAYLGPVRSHLTFWHGTPEVNEALLTNDLGEYYMPFRAKADYPGHYDDGGIPLLDYHGTVGLQYNPIAIAQYGLGNYNLFCANGDSASSAKFLAASDWLVANLEKNASGLSVWNHHFDWEYRTPLKAPWYSCLSQGQGISLLVRAHKVTGKETYLDAARRAFQTFLHTTADGGVTDIDGNGCTWFEETIVEPPTHILNGFIWAAWGVYDYHLYTGSLESQKLFDEAVRTLKANLQNFDTGYWSLYEQAGKRLSMLASPFYHRLHIVQLRVMHRLTGDTFFSDYAERWDAYRNSRFKSTLALAYKAVFKLLYY